MQFVHDKLFRAVGRGELALKVRNGQIGLVARLLHLRQLRGQRREVFERRRQLGLALFVQHRRLLALSFVYACERDSFCYRPNTNCIARRIGKARAYHFERGFVDVFELVFEAFAPVALLLQLRLARVKLDRHRAELDRQLRKKKVGGREREFSVCMMLKFGGGMSSQPTRGPVNAKQLLLITVYGYEVHEIFQKDKASVTRRCAGSSRAARIPTSCSPARSWEAF